MKRHIFIIAGEASGDLYGAHLAKHIKSMDPDVTLSGLGGEKMSHAGVRLYYDLVSIAVVGIFEVLKELSTFKKIFRMTAKKLDEVKPDAVILIDYPGFNLRFAKEAKKRGIKVIYYISPQVWAWGKKRIKLMRKVVDRMIVLFAFEEKLYKENGIDAIFAGHPIIDIAVPSMEMDEAVKSFGLTPGKPTVALIAGSRAIEVKRMLPAMLRASRIIKKVMPDTQFVISKSPTLDEGIYTDILNKESMRVSIARDNIYDCLNVCDIALVCSGTATIDTAIMGKPMVVVYKLSNLTYFLLKHLVSTPNIAMANIIAQKTVVPELIQFDMTPEKIAAEALGILRNEERSDSIKEGLKEVKDALGGPGGSGRAAAAALEAIG